MYFRLKFLSGIRLCEVKNTIKNTNWAMRVFGAWLSEHNEHSEEKCPGVILFVDDKTLVCHWLCVFVNEVIKAGVHAKKYMYQHDYKWNSKVCKLTAATVGEVFRSY